MIHHGAELGVLRDLYARPVFRGGADARRRTA
jgi:hypothetical protein